MNFITKAVLIGTLVVLGLAAGFFFLASMMANASLQGATAFDWAVAI